MYCFYTNNNNYSMFSTVLIFWSYDSNIYHFGYNYFLDVALHNYIPLELGFYKLFS